MRAHGGLQGFDRMAQVEDAGDKPIGERADRAATRRRSSAGGVPQRPRPTVALSTTRRCWRHVADIIGRNIGSVAMRSDLRSMSRRSPARRVAARRTAMVERHLDGARLHRDRRRLRRRAHVEGRARDGHRRIVDRRPRTAGRPPARPRRRRGPTAGRPRGAPHRSARRWRCAASSDTTLPSSSVIRRSSAVAVR